jgi:hypothetical protein
MSYPTYKKSYEVFPFEPLLPIRETLETATNILTASDGSEQRIAVNPVPRQGFTYEVYLKDKTDMTRFDALLFGWQKTYFALPIWPERRLHTGSISAGASSITVDTSYADYRDATLAIIWQSSSSFEPVLINVVSAGSFSLTGTVQRNWSGTKYIMPCRLAQVIAPAQTAQASRHDGHRRIDFRVYDNVLLTSHVEAVTYPPGSAAASDELVTQASLIGAAEQSESNSDGTVQDYGTGDFQFFSDSEHNVLSRQYIRRSNTRQQCWEFREWLHSFYGRQAVKWFPTYRADLQLVNNIGSSDTEFLIEDAGLSENMGLNTLRTHLAFELANGSKYYREILAVDNDSSGYESVQIDSAIGVTVQSTDTVSFLDKCRRGSDQLEIMWTEPNENVCSLPLVGVKQ